MLRIKTDRSLHIAASSAAGGALWVVGGILGGASNRWPLLAGTLVLAALPLLLATLLGLAARLQPRLGGSVRWVQGLAWAGAGLAGAARVVEPVAGSSSAPLFGAGVFLLSAALMLLGSGALRTATEPGWEGMLLLVGLLGLFLPVGAGIAGTAGLAAWAIWGTGWIWIGNVLRQVPTAAQPFRGWNEAVERSRQ